MNMKKEEYKTMSKLSLHVKSFPQQKLHNTGQAFNNRHLKYVVDISIYITM